MAPCKVLNFRDVRNKTIVEEAVVGGMIDNELVTRYHRPQCCAH